MDRKLIDYLPPVLASILEMQAIMEIEQPEAEMLWDKLSGVMDDQFVETASEERVKRWESRCWRRRRKAKRSMKGGFVF